jgi:hypothetical protein
MKEICIPIQAEWAYINIELTLERTFCVFWLLITILLNELKLNYNCEI